MSNIKSITTVQLYGADRAGCWGVRLRKADGTELFAGATGERWTLATAQAVAAANRTDAPMRDSISGQERSVYETLPAGVTVKAA